MKTPRLIILCLLASLICCYAQGDLHRTCRIVFYNRPANAPKALHLFDGTSSQEVELPSMNFSPVYKLASGAITLKLLTAKVEDPKNVAPDAPSVAIPEDYRDFFLLVSSDPNHPIAPVSLKAINLASENFKLGQMMWINHSDKTIEAKLGEQVLAIEPDSTKILDAPLREEGVPKSGFYTASFTYQSQDKATFLPITEQSWWYDANCRHLGFIENSNRKLPKIFFFRDFRDPETSENEAE